MVTPPNDKAKRFLVTVRVSSLDRQYLVDIPKVWLDGLSIFDYNAAVDRLVHEALDQVVYIFHTSDVPESFPSYDEPRVLYPPYAEEELLEECPGCGLFVGQCLCTCLTCREAMSSCECDEVEASK